MWSNDVNTEENRYEMDNSNSLYSYLFLYG